MRSTGKFSKLVHWLSLLSMVQLALSCGAAKDTLGTATGTGGSSTSESGTLDSGSTFKVAGTLDVSTLGLTSLGLLSSTVLIKATYAKEAEDSGTLSGDGTYNITVKPVPFALTIFVDESPTCSFIFSVGEQKIGSIQPSGDMDFGKVSCIDGQVAIDEKVTSGKLDQNFKDKVIKGDVSDEIKAKILDPQGLSITMLAMNGGKDGGGGQQPQKQPNQVNSQAPRLALNGGPGGGPGGPGGPQMIDPKVCTAAGYNVPDFFFQDFHNQDAGKESEGDGNAPTLFVEEKADGTYRMRAESKGGDGQQQVDVFENIKLGGTGDEFALVGAAPVNPSELKAMAAEGALREILFTFNTGNEPPPMPTWTDLSCDPVQLVNNIITTLGREPYDNSPIFQQMGGGNFPKPTFRANGVSKPLCSAVSGSGSTLLTIKDFCFESDGITLKKQTVTAAKMICQVAKEAGPVNYWNAKLKDDKGEPVKSCIKESNNKWGTGYRREFVDQTQAQCDASRLASMTTPPSDGSWMNYDWRDVERNMNLDCSELRVAKVKLKECQFNFDVAVEPSFTQPSYDEQPQPDRWWDGKFTLVDAAVAIDEARSKKMNGGGMSPLDHVKQQIDMCSANFDRTVKELNNRRAKIDGITTAVSLIATTKNAAGNLKYIKENADGFVKKGDFSFTSDQVAKLQAVLKKAVTSLDGWADSIKKIKDTYMVIKNAALKAEADDSHKCVADEIGSKAAFTTIYVRFDQAYNGVTNDKTSRGLKNWQEIALNHFQCMDMDQNLLRIRNFGISAPISGIEDSNASAANAKEALLTAEAATCDFTDGRGRCIKNIACQIPAGAETYVPFNTLLDKGEIEAGCEGVTQKVAMMGRVNAHDHKVNSIEVPAGQLVASVLLMTSMPKKSCSLTLKVPSMDKDSCFVYANAEGKSWGELTADERKAATASDYSLAYDSKKVPMLNIANREVIQVMLTPNSDVPTLKETEVGTVKSDSGNSDLDSLIQLDK